MKKLAKLSINPEKLMTDGELITLKGGANWTCMLICDGIIEAIIPVEAETQEDACWGVQYMYPNYIVICDPAY